MDILLSSSGLAILSPLLAACLLAVMLQDGRSPVYLGERVGFQQRRFRMTKIRSMFVGADSAGIESTASTDPRITRLGGLIRRAKLDELLQLWNVLAGDMSLVGPRPNTPRSVASYTEFEKIVFEVRPGITDFSSIVFADEGDILRGSADPESAYEKLIRPWKSRLGVFYVRNRSIVVDLVLVVFTLVAIVNRPVALAGTCWLLGKLGADRRLIDFCRRRGDLVPTEPPQSEQFAL
jgi:lipopolysaccharide/colanic/teichoic acid biosynthesis glycosyltransferase